MNVREVIAVIHQMQIDAVIDGYAIGGAVGATFFLEPIATLDVDIFVSFRPEPGALIITPLCSDDYFSPVLPTINHQ